VPDPGPLLIDTDVLVDYLRGDLRALAYLKAATSTLRISCLTLSELYVGIRDGAERNALTRLEDLLEVIPIDRDIAVQGGLLLRATAPA
jgi:predicted nucleic acid-binding protein